VTPEVTNEMPDQTNDSRPMQTGMLP